MTANFPHICTKMHCVMSTHSAKALFDSHLIHMYISIAIIESHYTRVFTDRNLTEESCACNFAHSCSFMGKQNHENCKQI